MSDRTAKIVYWVATAIVAIVYLGAAAFYLTQTETVKQMYAQLGYPAYLVVPLAIAKIIGAVVILWRPSAMLADWAYGAMFFHILLAIQAHFASGVPTPIPAIVTLIALVVSWWTANRVRAVKSAYAPGAPAEG